MSESYQLVVIGAGPAGMCAAVTASSLGVKVLLLDEQDAVGGQIYNSITKTNSDKLKVLGQDYNRGTKLVAELLSSKVEYWSNSSVWSLDSDRNIKILHCGQPMNIKAEQIIIATGAMERPVAFPGWTLPGVMNLGAAQILLKSAGIVPQKKIVIAGSGPLLLLVAWQYIQANIPISAILELSPRNNLFRSMPFLPAAIFSGNYIARGLKYYLALKKAGIPIYYGVSNLKAIGNDKLESVQYSRFASSKSIDTDHLLLHFGLLPRTDLTKMAGCQHVWNKQQLCWHAVANQWGESSVPGIKVVGDSSGIYGARSAEYSGRLAAFEVSYNLKVINHKKRDNLSKEYFSKKRRDRRCRPFLEALHYLPKSILVPSDDNTIVCRCEEITKKEITAAVQQGHKEPNQVKYYLRCGMGPCQGRQCETTIVNIIAAENQCSVAEYSNFTNRPPIRPITIGQLATMRETVE